MDTLNRQCPDAEIWRVEVPSYIRAEVQISTLNAFQLIGIVGSNVPKNE